MDDKLTGVVQQLGLSDANDYNGVMDQLLQSIINSCEKLQAKIDTAGEPHEAIAKG
jgi:hypothetical protein